MTHSVEIQDDPLWYKDVIIYQLHVKTFYDSNGDGYGDFAGLIEKLDYIEELGVTCIWILPFYPSPLRDDGYDIADYVNINPLYGSMQDAKNFITEAHRRGIRVITELVINHTPGFNERVTRRQEVQSATFMFGVIPLQNSKMLESSLSTQKLPIGRSTRLQNNTTGTDFSLTNLI